MIDLSRVLFKDSSGKPSTTATVFTLGAVVINVKILLSGMTVFGVTMSEFTGVDYGAALSALGGIYILRRRGSSEPTAEVDK